MHLFVCASAPISTQIPMLVFGSMGGICMYARMCMYMHICTYWGLYVCVYVCMYVCMCICMCMFICIYQVAGPIRVITDRVKEIKVEVLKSQLFIQLTIWIDDSADV
jgi:hypothetical protein